MVIPYSTEQNNLVTKVQIINFFLHFINMESKLSLLSQLDKNPQYFAQNFYLSQNGTVTSPFLPIDHCYLLNPPHNRNLIPLTPESLNNAVYGPIGTYYTNQEGDLIKIYRLNAFESLNIIYRHKPIPAMIQLMNYFNSLTLCQNYPDLTTLKFISSDRFTNSTLINTYLSYLFSHSSTPQYPTILNFQTSNLCPSNIATDRHGLQLFEHVDGGTLLNISNNKNFDTYRTSITVTEDQSTSVQLILAPKIIISLVKQMLITLDYLQQNFHFFHGHLITANLFLSSQPFLDAPFTIKLANFDTASLSLHLSTGTYRLHYRNWIDDNLTERTPFIPHIFTGPNYNTYYFIPRDYPIRYYERTLSLGIPFYPTFDTYTFIISLLLIPEIYHSVFSSPLQQTIWDPLWINEDRSTATLRLQQLVFSRSPNSFDNIFDMLRDLRLNCDITHHLLSLLPKI